MIPAPLLCRSRCHWSSGPLPGQVGCLRRRLYLAGSTGSVCILLPCSSGHCAPPIPRFKITAVWTRHHASLVPCSFPTRGVARMTHSTDTRPPSSVCPARTTWIARVEPKVRHDCLSRRSPTAEPRPISTSAFGEISGWPDGHGIEVRRGCEEGHSSPEPVMTWWYHEPVATTAFLRPSLHIPNLPNLLHKEGTSFHRWLLQIAAASHRPNT